LLKHIDHPIELVTTSSDRQADTQLPVVAMAALATEPVHVVATYPSGVTDGIAVPGNATVHPAIATHGRAALAFETMFSIRQRDGPRCFVESAVCARTRVVCGRARRLVRSLSGGAPVTTDAVHQLKADLARFSYLADEGLATAIHLAVRLRRPLLLEGEAGAGKTEVAKTLARLSGAKLLRLQCYEGIDVSQAVYEWDYARQLLHLKAAETGGAEAVAAAEDELFSERFLVRRPLLQALDNRDGPPPVLLIDEIDRADDEFEAFLLEMLSDFAVTVPELGTFVAEVPPLVVLTSNRTRDLHDALKRRCLYHWVDHPSIDREVAIVRLRVPEASERLARRVAAAVEALRGLDLYKPPGVAETIDWARALAELGEPELADIHIEHTLGWVLKYREDIEKARAAGLDTLVRVADDDV